jgi:hypothetical protein
MLTTGSFVDEKDYTVDTDQKNSAVTRMLFSDKMKNSTARVITWSTSPGLMFQHTGFFPCRCPEIHLVEPWGKEKIETHDIDN